MKKSKFILNGLLFLAMVLAGFDAMSTGTVTLGGTPAGKNLGDTVMLPLRITTVNQVHNIVIAFDYNQDILAPQASLFIFNSTWTPAQGKAIEIVNPTYFGGSTFYLSILTPDDNTSWASMTNQLVGYFCFIYTGGAPGFSNVHLRRSTSSPVCGFFTFTGNSIAITTYSPDFLVSGTTGLPPKTLYSRPSDGPIDWDAPASWSDTYDGDPGMVLTPAKCFNVVIQGDEVSVQGYRGGTVSSIAKCINLTIKPGGKLTTVRDDENLIDGKLSVSGNMVLQGDATNTGSYVEFGSTPVSVGGTTTVERKMNGNWIMGQDLYDSHLVSSPTAAQSNSIFYGSLMNIWNEKNQNWDPLTKDYITMGVGTGYAVSPLNPGITAAFSGTLNVGDKTVAVASEAAGAATWKGYNLVGNPYPSAINWDSVTLSNVGITAWIWNMAGNYLANNQGDGYLIAAEQGFFVHATAAGSVTFKNRGRTHGPSTFYKSAGQSLLTLKVEGRNYWDQAQVSIRPMAAVGFDADYDAIKMTGMDYAPQLYSMVSDQQLSINALPDLNGSPVIQFGFTAGSVNNFTLTAKGLESFATGTEFFLEDLVANTVINLQVNPTYTFAAAPGQQEHRFNLHFAPVGMQDTKTTSDIKIYSAEKTVYVNIPTDMRGSIVVYNMLGSEITRTTIQTNSLNKISLNVPSGFYLVKVDGDSSTLTSKVFIK
ncbi:MAG: T9SS type A sorting domain-containing protein [Bacteroidetes bacterium]|nr:T9SS type A sorting domain-containing protein [Bacteroidota bacterium]